MSQRHLFFFLRIWKISLGNFRWSRKVSLFLIVFLNVQPTVLQLEYWPISEGYTSVLSNCPDKLHHFVNGCLLRSKRNNKSKKIQNFLEKKTLNCFLSFQQLWCSFITTWTKILIPELKCTSLFTPLHKCLRNEALHIIFLCNFYNNWKQFPDLFWKSNGSSIFL